MTHINFLAYQTLFNNLEDAVLVVNQNKLIMEANAVAKQLFNAPGKTLYDRKVGGVLAQPGLCWQQDIKSSFQWSSAAHEDFIVHVFPINNQENQLESWVFRFKDISQQKQLDQIRDDIILTMVHDLRAPLANIAGTLQWFDKISEKYLSEQDLKLLTMAETSASRLLEMIAQILDIGRLEMKGMQPNRDDFVLPELVENILIDYRIQAQQKKLQLDADIDPTLPPVNGDYNLISRVLQNLLQNGIKFTPENGRVCLIVTHDKQNVGKIRLTVTDTGVGITTALQNRIFEKYSRGNHPQRGNGLGLAFCKMAIDAHGEKIWVETTNAGTSVSFTLPISTLATNPSAKRS